MRKQRLNLPQRPRDPRDLLTLVPKVSRRVERNEQSIEVSWGSSLRCVLSELRSKGILYMALGLERLDWTGTWLGIWLIWEMLWGRMNDIGKLVGKYWFHFYGDCKCNIRKLVLWLSCFLPLASTIWADRKLHAMFITMLSSELSYFQQDSSSFWILANLPVYKACIVCLVLVGSIACSLVHSLTRPTKSNFAIFYWQYWFSCWWGFFQGYSRTSLRTCSIGRLVHWSKTHLQIILRASFNTIFR